MDKKALGKELQKYRERAGYSQETLAEIIDCSAIFISYIERGVKAPSLDTLIKLANALDISIDILLRKDVQQSIPLKLVDIEKQLQCLPYHVQQKILDIIDATISIEIDYYFEEKK